MKPIQERTKGGIMGNNNKACRALQTPPSDDRSFRVSRTLSTGFDPFASLLFVLAASALFWPDGASALTAPIQFGTSSYSFNEDDGTVTVDVQKPTQIQDEATVDFTVTNGTAIAGIDFIVQTPSPLLWLQTDTSAKTISIQILPNSIVETAKSFQIELSNAQSTSGEAQLGTVTTTTVTIQDDDPGAGTVATIVSGDGQSAVVGGTLDSLVLEISDAGQAVENALVTWSVSPPGAATLQSNASQTGSDGRASNSLTLNEDGIGQVTVTAVAQAVGRVDFAIDTGLGNLPPAVESLGKVSGDAQLAEPGETLDPFVVQLTDQGGQPVVGTEVSWTVEPAEAGSLIENTTSTDSAGETRNTLTLDPTASGAVTVTAAAVRGTQVVFTVNSTQFGDLDGLTPNERETAQALDNTCAALEDGTEGLEALAAACSATGAEALTVIEQVTPDQVASQGATSVDIQHTQFTNINTRLVQLRGGATGPSASGLTLNFKGQPLLDKGFAYLLSNAGGGAASADEPSPFGRLGVFINGSGSFGDTNSTTDELGFDFDTKGITAGADYRVTNTLILGGALGYVSSDYDFDNNQGDQDITGYTVSAFGTWYQSEKVYVDGILSYGWNDFDLKRRIRFGTTDITAKGSPDGTEFAASIGAGYDFNRGALSFGPYGRLNYITADIDGYEENPAGGLEQGYDDQDVDSLTTLLGGQVSYAISTRRGVFSPQLRLEWAHEFEGDSQNINARFLNDPTGGTFNVGTDDPDRDYFNLGAGVAAVIGPGRSAFIYYETSAGRDEISEHSIAGGLRFEF
jgi:outer membrane autotransporter protein